MQDRRNCDRSYGDRIYLHEECAGWKNLSGSGVGVSHPVFLLKGKDHKTGRNGNGINSFDMNKKNKENYIILDISNNQTNCRNEEVMVIYQNINGGKIYPRNIYEFNEKFIKAEEAK